MIIYLVLYMNIMMAVIKNVKMEFIQMPTVSKNAYVRLILLAKIVLH